MALTAAQARALNAARMNIKNKANRPRKFKAGGPRNRKAKRRGGRARVQRIAHRMGQVSMSSQSLVHRKTRQVAAMARVGAPNYWTDTYSGIVATAAAFQSYGSFANINQTLAKALLGLVPGGTVGTPKRMVIENAGFEYTMTNNSNVPIEVDIYDLTIKRDILTSLTFNANSQAYTVLPYPEQYWAEGSNAQAGYAGNTYPAQANFLGSLPQDSRLFLDYFTVSKKTIVQLPMSGTHRHQVNIKAGKLLDDYLANSTTSGIKGLTSYVMIVVRGFPIYAIPESPAPAAVTTSSASLNVVQSVRVKYTWVADVSFTTNANANISTVAPSFQNSFNWGNGAAQTTIGFPSQ